MTIPETHAVGDTVVRVNASDADGDAISYHLINLNSETSRLFMIDSRTGEIITRGNIMVRLLLRLHPSLPIYPLPLRTVVYSLPPYYNLLLQRSPSGQQFVSYILTVEASDQQYPKECVKTTPVSITIRRDRILPRVSYTNRYDWLSEQTDTTYRRAEKLL